MLKKLWDFRSLVDGTFDDWKSQLWAEINTEDLEDRTKKGLSIPLKQMGDAHPTMKAWAVYRTIDQRVRNMAAVLPLIAELHADAMRPRHWTQLSAVCKRREIPHTAPTFCLENVLELELHTHVDDVDEIVEVRAGGRGVSGRV